MPIYEFKCNAEKCGKSFESLIWPNQPVQCPECKTIKVDRQMSTFGHYKIQGDNSASVTPRKFGSKKDA